jgi:acetylornithine/succinyldiaminopimelate/putrescine aminotransferase
LFKKELDHPAIKSIRGEGLLLAVQLKSKEQVSKVVAKAPESGLILDYFLFCNDAFRIAPPLVISNIEIKYACKQLLSLLDSTL